MRSRVTGSISPIDRPINYKGAYQPGTVYFPNELVERSDFYWLYIYPIPFTAPSPTTDSEGTYWIKIGSSENPNLSFQALDIGISEITGLSAQDVQEALQQIYDQSKDIVVAPASTESLGLVKIGDGILPNTSTGNIELLQSPYLDERASTGPKNIFYVSTTGYDHPDAGDLFRNAAKIVKQNRESIINFAFQSIQMPSDLNNNQQVSIELCKRDIGFFVDAIAADLGNSTSSPTGFLSNLYAMQAAKAYYDINGVRRITTAEITPTTQAFSSAATQIISLIGSGYSTFVNGLTTLVNGYIVNGINWSAAPALTIGVQRGRYIDGGNLITANKTYIINTVLTQLQSSIPQGAEDKCRRDLEFIIEAVVKDIQCLSNTNVINVGRNYYGSDGLQISDVGNPSELEKTITAFTLTRQLCMQAIQNKLPNTSDYDSVANDLNPALFLPNGRQHEGSECASVASAAYALFNIVIGYLENGLGWDNAPKQNPGLTRKSLPGQTVETAYKTIKRALQEVKKFPGKECTVRVGSGRFYEDNPLEIPQPKTAVVGDNLRTTTVIPLNHGKDLFLLDSGTYLNYMVFEDNYLGGYGVLQTPAGFKEISADTMAFSLFPGHTIKDVPGRFKDAVDLIRANRSYIIGQVTNYNAAFIIDAVIADLRITGNIAAITAGSNPLVINTPNKITQIRELIQAAIRNELPNGQADEINRDFSTLEVGGSQRVSDLCANVQATVATLVEIIQSIKNGNEPPERNTGTLLLINQELIEIESVVDNVVNVFSRGVATSATRHISGSKCTQNAKAFRYAAAFKHGTNIFLSPYIQNCSNISVLGRTVLKGDGSGELDDSKTLAGGILVDGGVLANTSPIASMVMDAFTQIVSGSVGFHHKRNGYSQLVSVFQVFEDVGILCESGAYTSVTNSATNFGNVGLKAVGFSDTAFPFYKGNISSAQNVTLNFNRTPSNIFSSKFTSQGNQTKVTLIVEGDKIAQFVPGQTIDVTDHDVAIANGTGFIITEVIASERAVSYLVNSPFPTNGILPGTDKGTVEIKVGRLVTKIAIQGFTSIPLPNYIVKIAGVEAREDNIEYVVEESTTINAESGICTITLQIPWPDTLNLPSNGTAIELRRPSTVNSSAHTFEFIGSGINYTALPENGGVTDPQSQTLEINAGRVYCSATDQDGNFTVGPFFNVDLKSGKVTFTGTVSLGVIDEIQLKNSPGVPIRQFDIDPDLGGLNGALHTRIATQKAVRDFLQVNLGDLFKRKITTSGGNELNKGQIVILDDEGYIGRSQLPPTNPFRVITVADTAARLALTLTQVSQGDYVIENDSKEIYILKTISGEGPSLEENWAILPSGPVSASDLNGIIDPANLGSVTLGTNNKTFLAGSKAYLPVVRSIEGEGAVSVGTLSTTPTTDEYPVNSKVGDVLISINTASFAQGQTSGSSSLGVAKYAYDDFDIIEGQVFIREQAVDLNQIKHISGLTVLGNDNADLGMVRTLPLNEVVPTVVNINVSFVNNNFLLSVNNRDLGTTLYLTRGQTYKFNINTPGNPFQLALSEQTPYSIGLQGTNGVALTNPDTKFIWTVPLDAPDTLRYQSSTSPSIGGTIITDKTYTGSANKIVVNSNNSIDLATVIQTDTNGTEGINFVQSISKDGHGRITGRVLADIRTASTTRSGIVQLNSSTNSTSTTEAATPLAVKTLYDYVSLVTPTAQFSWDNNAVTTPLAKPQLTPSSELISSLYTRIRGCLLLDNGTVNYYLNPNNWELKEDGNPSVLTGVDGMVMVEIPKFYVKNASGGTLWKPVISPLPLPGFEIHPAFIKDGVEVDYRYYSAYDACVFRASDSTYISGLNLDGVNSTTLPGFNINTDMLASVSGIYPMVGLTRPEFRALAHRRGTGWRLGDFALWSAIGLLMAVEAQTFDGQAVYGAGNTNSSYPTSSSNQDDSPHTPAGAGNLIGNGSTNTISGSGVNQRPGISYMKYRGIENFWGNCWNWTDGINLNGLSTTVEVYWTNNRANFVDGTAANQQLLGTIPQTNSAVRYATKFNQNTTWALVPTEVSTASSHGTTDGFWSADGWRGLLVGGSALGGGLAGAFAFSGYHVAGYRLRLIGARLSY